MMTTMGDVGQTSNPAPIPEGNVLEHVFTHADAVVLTDRRGRVLRTMGRLQDIDDLAESLDLVVGAVNALGARHDSGVLDTVLLSYRQRVIMVANTPLGHVAVFAGIDVQPGLLWAQLRKLQQETSHEATI